MSLFIFVPFSLLDIDNISTQKAQIRSSLEIFLKKQQKYLFLWRRGGGPFTERIMGMIKHDKAHRDEVNSLGTDWVPDGSSSPQTIEI